MNILNFIFQDFVHFVGTLILIGVIGAIIRNAIYASKGIVPPPNEDD